MTRVTRRHTSSVHCRFAVVLSLGILLLPGAPVDAQERRSVPVTDATLQERERRGFFHGLQLRPDFTI